MRLIGLLSTLFILSVSTVYAQISDVQPLFLCGKGSHGGSAVLLRCGGSLLDRIDIAPGGPASCSATASVSGSGSSIDIAAQGLSNELTLSGIARASWRTEGYDDIFFQSNSWGASGLRFTVKERSYVRLQMHSTARPTLTSTHQPPIAQSQSQVLLGTYLGSDPFDFQIRYGVFATHDQQPIADVDQILALCPGNYVIVSYADAILNQTPSGPDCFSVFPPIERDLGASGSYSIDYLFPANRCDIE